MKILMLKTLAMIRSMLGLNKKSANIDSVIEENYELIKQIRMNRMKFYRYYKKAQAGV